MTWAADTTEIIARDFALREGCIDVHADARTGFHLWDPERRAELERNRQEYKTEKQRSYDANKRATLKASRICVACSGQLGRPYRCMAKCSSCGAENYVPSSKRSQ